ncbi:ATP-binding protein, partial [Pantoea sp.]|uniref:ATP-binding protein n=1 Tax=Pantoea sp. TaxID=69393 RepID=UPI00289AF273
CRSGIESQRFNDRTSLYEALASGRIDALADNVLSARWLAASRYPDRIHLAFAASDIAWPIAMGVSPAQPLLREILDKGLQQIPPETQRQMRDNWSMPPQPDSERAMRSLPAMVLAAAIMAIVVLLILLARRYLQQRQERLQREQAERANQMKSQFLATVSHELRTPMQATLGLLELEQQQRNSLNLTLLHSSARSLLTLLNDLQDHARIESNSFTLAPRPLDLSRWLAQLQHFYHPLMHQAGPRLVVEALTPLPDRVMIDGDRLQQVTNNLVANALKFTRKGEIRLTLAVAQQITLTISDSGSGIPPDEQQKLFDPWYQAPSGKTVSVQGSGLGLFICREIVQRMGGNIRLRSTPGVGTCVTVTLPLQPVEGAALHPVVSPDWPGYPSLRAAIVDDHPANLLVMQQQLARFAIDADCFAEGRALLRADAAQPYDLLFIDQMMPRPDGALLLRILRRRDRQRRRRSLRVLCSADAQLLRADAALSNEIVLIKPLALQDIARVLAEAFSDPLVRLEENINALAQHNQKYVARLSATLRQSLQHDSQAIEAALAAHNWSDLVNAAHRMKSSWLLLDISQGAALSQQLVEKAKLHQDASEERKLLILLTNRLLEKLESYGPHTQSHGK